MAAATQRDLLNVGVKLALLGVFEWTRPSPLLCRVTFHPLVKENVHKDMLRLCYMNGILKWLRWNDGG
jgi:hypothetical protein